MLVTLIAFVVVATFVAPVSRLQANPSCDRWHFSATEIEAAYHYQATFGKGLRQPLQARSCLYGAKRFSARFYGKEVRLPCHFITENLRHLRAILESGAARYLFPLDLDHAHLAISKASWQKKYSRLPSEKILPAMLEDPKLVALYHSAEHLSIFDFKTSKVNTAAKAWRDKRNILAFYDGRPIEILPPHPDGRGASIPEEYYGYGGFDFLANSQGRLAVLLKDAAIPIDMTLQIGTSIPSLP
jgi:hypothetical protein